MRIKAGRDRLTIKVLLEANETKTKGGIILPDNQNKTKEVAQGQVIDINDPESKCDAKLNDIVLFRSGYALQCGDGVVIINVAQVEGIIDKEEVVVTEDEK
ncbi:MAG: hypothetical protein HRU18_01380 [Pseudoalteromonas sp.]|uniref:hypothetical protein n=1 Tax=Pseudoalteromonas sp. TaxID=53249 RepID=UPI001DFD64E2|nr:hypothetical protein [Pseudoalteromonas sp.]NRA76832.1 hypothetical protein [Pseudoalteromonas sp.]